MPLPSFFFRFSSPERFNLAMEIENNQIKSLPPLPLFLPRSDLKESGPLKSNTTPPLPYPPPWGSATKKKTTKHKPGRKTSQSDRPERAHIIPVPAIDQGARRAATGPGDGDGG